MHSVSVGICWGSRVGSRLDQAKKLNLIPASLLYKLPLWNHSHSIRYPEI